MSSFSRRTLLLSTSAILLLKSATAPAQIKTRWRPPAIPPHDPNIDTEWRYYAADPANTRYAPLDQINASNFNDLEVAWRFKADALGAGKEYQFEVTPLLVKGRLFLTAGKRRDAVALDAATGEMLWMYRLDEGVRATKAPRQLSGRGCSYWTDGKIERVFFVTIGYQLVCLDALTGFPDPSFGKDGLVDLKKDFDQGIDAITADVGLHATPLVVKDMVVVGAAHSPGNVPSTRFNVKGYVRAFDARTGARKWIFHTIPRRGEFGYDSWLDGDADAIGNCGVWAQMSADEELGLVYLPVELPTGDEVGIYRKGNALFGESLVAVDAMTGERRWHYQLVHHGLWDCDIPCAPILCDIPVGGKMVKALAQPTKQAFLYVLDRETGRPIWPIVERPVPRGDVPGEWYSPTQPIPTKPPAYDRQGTGSENLINFTPELHAEALKLVKSYVTGPLFTPPTLSKPGGGLGTLVLPGMSGGTNWPGGSYDPETCKVYVCSQTMIQLAGIIPVTDKRISDFAYVTGISGTPPQGPERGPAVRPGTLSVQGLPLVAPPYGRITAIDLTKGEISWQIAHGETPDSIRDHPALKGLKIPRTGREGYLGPLCTKALIICGEAGFFTNEQGIRGAMLRAYDKATGEEKGAVYLPAPQSGSPMTYMLSGHQYIVVAIGGGNYSGELVAFRLPSKA